MGIPFLYLLIACLTFCGVLNGLIFTRLIDIENGMSLGFNLHGIKIDYLLIFIVVNENVNIL